MLRAPALSPKTWRKPISYWVVSSLLTWPVFTPKLPSLTNPCKSSSDVTTSIKVGCWMNLPYWAWNTVDSVTGKPRPILGETKNSGSFVTKSSASKILGSPKANGKASDLNQES